MRILTDKEISDLRISPKNCVLARDLRKIRAFWSVMLILLPIALLFAENTLYSLQGLTIIAAFPVGVLLVMIVVSFFKDFHKWEKEP